MGNQTIRLSKLIFRQRFAVWTTTFFPIVPWLLCKGTKIKREEGERKQMSPRERRWRSRKGRRGCGGGKNGWQIGVDGFLKYRNQEIQRMSADNADNSVANFIQKSFQILENKEYESIIHWMTNGREFAIKEIDDFQDHILPKYFRHRNINSFIRQLNMYGFHKSRKDPSKNIFSHPFFQRGHPQLLHLVKRKIKNQDNKEEEHKHIPVSPPPKQTENIEPPTAIASHKSLVSLTFLKDVHKEKDIAPTKTEIAAGPFSMLSIRSFGLALGSEVSPFKNLMEKSCIMDSNPEVYLVMRDNNSMGQVDVNLMEDDDDNLSIEDQIEKERRVFQNRRSGVSILQTYNLLEDLDFLKKQL